MPACQIPLPLLRPVRARVRNVRRPFSPSSDTGSYRLPHDVRDRLGSALAPYRNREAAYALAVFIARYWSAPSRIEGGFSIDRRAIANRPGLDLTEARVRGAIRVLEEIGFLDRIEPDRGSRYRSTADGLHRKPVSFRLGLDYRASFEIANKRAAAARGRQLKARRPHTPERTQRPSPGLPPSSPLNSPKLKTSEADRVNLGELRKAIGLPPKNFEPDPKLEAALERLKEAIGNAGEPSGPLCV